jgi:hypothetical protein
VAVDVLSRVLKERRSRRSGSDVDHSAEGPKLGNGCVDDGLRRSRVGHISLNKDGRGSRLSKFSREPLPPVNGPASQDDPRAYVLTDEAARDGLTKPLRASINDNDHGAIRTVAKTDEDMRLLGRGDNAGNRAAQYEPCDGPP